MKGKVKLEQGQKRAEILFPLISCLLHAIGAAWLALHNTNKVERGCIYCIWALQGRNGISRQDGAT